MVIIIIVMPAIYLAYTFVDQNNFYLNAERYINTVFTERGDVIIYKISLITHRIENNLSFPR